MWLWLCICGALVKVMLDCVVSIKWGICSIAEELLPSQEGLFIK
jgi:hypothetical protein